ncbi:helix-turn-helix domain-containing protein [Arcanobacterium urinimassiliense]|uniref:helix-turn-helix domain-containing protein n=1 Tax=Arcanobacterium urinimassiliense TaxID=1871014 RepID=UPI00093C4DB5|nr:helix-turn-helix transcriptional regulator [Arcanobacterium urinimassiliense]
MLNENIRITRKAKGLSQAELAAKVYVVRQTVSKWEKGLSVPDSKMLLALSEALETPVATLLGETISLPAASDLQAIAQKLEVINLQLAKRQEEKRKVAHGCFIALAVITVLTMVGLLLFGSPYLGWNYEDPETAVLGTIFHSFEWIFVRTAPIAIVAAVAGIVWTRKKEN